MGPSVLKEPRALKVSFVMLEPLLCLGQSGQGLLTLAIHWSHRGSLRDSWRLGPTAPRRQGYWSGSGWLSRLFLKVLGDWKEQPVLTATETTPGPLRVTLVAHADTHSPSPLALNPCQAGLPHHALEEMTR